MKKLACLVLLLITISCQGCCKTVRIYKEILDPDHSMGIIIFPIPMPDLPMPVPSWPPPEPLAEEGDPWCMLPGIKRV